MTEHETHETTTKEGEQRPLPEMWSDEARLEHLRLARLVEAPEDALWKARQSLMWLEMVHDHFGLHSTDGWCDDARYGLANIIGMIREKLEIADKSFSGKYSRED